MQLALVSGVSRVGSLSPRKNPIAVSVSAIVVDWPRHQRRTRIAISRQGRPGARPLIMTKSPWLRTERIVHARSTPRAARQGAPSGTAGCRHEWQQPHRFARPEVHRLRDGLVRREVRLAPRGHHESHRTLQRARLRLSRLLVCAVDRTRAAARVARSPAADDLLPHDRWIRGGRPSAGRR